MVHRLQLPQALHNSSGGDSNMTNLNSFKAKNRGSSTVLIIAGLFLLVMTFGLGIYGCSKEKTKSTSVSSSSQTSSPESTPTPAVSTEKSTTSAEAVTPKKKKAAPKRPATVSYNDNSYGLSFRYPRKYTLMTPAKAEENSKLLEKVPMNFAQPGGVTVATIELPGSSSTSFFNVSVNKGVTSSQCEQFSVPSPSDLATNSPVDPDDESIPSKDTINGVEFLKVANATENDEIKYFHHFEPGHDELGGTCYEFAMGIEDAPDSNSTWVDHLEIFDKLERIMATVKIKPQDVSAVTADVPGHETTPSNPQ
jgi:hypothetical protein